MGKKDKKNLIKIGTFLDETVILKGDVHSGTNLKVDGEVHGNVSSSEDVVIGESAQIIGNIAGRDIVISGSVQGDISAEETVTLTAKGKIIGNISATGFVVDIGSHFAGNCTIIEPETAKTIPISAPPAPRGRRSQKINVKEEAREENYSSQELPVIEPVAGEVLADLVAAEG